MKQITLSIKENKYQFFLELVKNFDFIKIESTDEGDSKEAILANIKQGLKEVKLIEQGKMKARPAKDFINEL